MPAPAHTPPIAQYARALQKANIVRLAGAEIKRELADGRISLKAALYDPRAESLTVIALLMAQYRWGRERAVRVCAEIPVMETKRVSTLTDRQRRAIWQQPAPPADPRRPEFDEVITVLAAEGGLRCQDLAAELGRSPFDTKGLLCAMQDRGMVTSQPSPERKERAIWSLPNRAAS